MLRPSPVAAANRTGAFSWNCFPYQRWHFRTDLPRLILRFMRNEDCRYDSALFLDSANAVLTVKIEALTEPSLAGNSFCLEDRSSCALVGAHWSSRPRLLCKFFRSGRNQRWNRASQEVQNNCVAGSFHDWPYISTDGEIDGRYFSTSCHSAFSGRAYAAFPCSPDGLSGDR